MGVKKHVNSIGMFNLFRGVGIFLVVLVHTIPLFEYPDKFLVCDIALYILFCIGMGVMPAFFIISGYGFRKRKVKDCLQQQIKNLIKPYCFTAIATIATHFAMHYIAFRYLPDALKETCRVAGGFLLGLPSATYYFGRKIFPNGPVWYILALFIGWLILDFVVERIPEKAVCRYVFVIAFCGWLAGRKGKLPFCLSQGMIATLYLYFGSELKKRKVLQNGIKKNCWIYLIIFCVVPSSVLLGMGYWDSMSDSIWTLGFISVLMDAGLGSILVYFSVKLNRFNNVLMNLISIIGKYSMLIFYVHTVEMGGIPWYLFVNKFESHPYIGFILLFLLRLSLIGSICTLIINRTVILNYIVKKRKTICR